jgi:membrane protease YdiL (CAAX protease family)
VQSAAGDLDEGSLPSERWRLIFPGIAGDIVLAIVRLVGWLLLLSYTEVANPKLHLLLVAAWVSGFLWRYALRRGSSQEEQLRLKRERATLGLTITRRMVPFVIALCAITAFAVPWWGAAFTGGCSSGKWVDYVWPIRGPLLPPELPIVFGVLLLLLQTATFPLIEEFSFRGWLFVPIRQRLGTNWAVLLLAIVFAFLHLTFHPGRFATLLLFGMLDGYALVATGSLWTPVATHFVWNLTNTLLGSLPIHSYFGEAFSSQLFRCNESWLMVLLTSVAFAAVVVIAHRRLHARNLNYRRRPD